MTKIDEIDRHVGQRVRMRRIQLDMSQSSVAEKMNVSFQSVQKFETAANRISAARLYKLSRILRVPISYFYEGYEESPEQKALNRSKAQEQEDLRLKSESADILNVYFSLPNKRLRQALIDMIRNVRDSKTGY